MSLKLIKDLIESDIFNIFSKSGDNKIGEVSNNILKKLSEDELEQLKLVSAIKTIKEGGNVIIPLSRIKYYKDKMEDWIYNNLTYPITNEETYKTILKTLKSEDKELINLLAFTYPEKIKKVLIYNAGKNESITPYTAIYHFLQELDLIGKYKYQSVAKHYTQKEEVEEKKLTSKNSMEKQESKNDFQKEKIVKEVSKEIVLNHLAENNREEFKLQQKYSLHKNQVKSFLEKSILTRKQNFQQTYKDFQSFDELPAQIQLQLKESFSANMKSIKERLIIKDISIPEIYTNIILPAFAEMNDELKKEVKFLWKLQDHDKEILDENIIGNGMFWKVFNTDKDFFQTVIQNTMKFDSYSDAKNYQLMFDVISMCSVNEQTFKDRLNFFEKMNLNLDGKVLSYAYFDKNGKPKIKTIDLEKLNDKTENKEFYKENVFVDLMLNMGNQMWNKVLNEKMQEKLSANNNNKKNILIN